MLSKEDDDDNGELAGRLTEIGVRTPAIADRDAAAAVVVAGEEDGPATDDGEAPLRAIDVEDARTADDDDEDEDAAADDKGDADEENGERD